MSMQQFTNGMGFKVEHHILEILEIGNADVCGGKYL